MIDVSIITISTNEWADLEPCLDSLFAVEGETRFEVIVIDNASTDGTSEGVARRFPQATLARNERKLGFATNNNIGMQYAKGRYCLFLNPDTVFFESGLDKIVAYMDENADVGASACKLVNPDGSLQYTCRRFPWLDVVLVRGLNLDRYFPNDRGLRSYMMLDWDHNTIRDVDWLLGAFLIVRSDVIDAVGTFDPAFDPLYYEDIDLCRRIKNAGFRVVYLPFTKIMHRYSRDSARGCFNRMTYHHIRNIVRFFMKYPSLIHRNRRES